MLPIQGDGDASRQDEPSVGMKDMPIWAQRATGKPRVRGSDDLIQALARARDSEDVIRVIFERLPQSAPVMSSLAAPALQVIEQIHKAANQEDNVQQAAQDWSQRQPAATVRSTRGTSRPFQRARVARGMTGLNGQASRPSSTGETRIAKLARRLQDLVHIAEVNNRRQEAQMGVRMAEDSAAARSEGGASPTQPDSGEEKKQVDIDALSREVVEAVQAAMEHRRERRHDGSSDNDFWW